MEKKNSLKEFLHPFTVKQKIWFTIGSLFFLCGFVFLVLYIVEIALVVPPTNNPILTADNAFKAWTKLNFGFLVWGIIALLLGALVLAIVLSVGSSTEDREKEKKARREARLKQMMEASAKPVDGEVVEEKTDAQ